MKTFKNYTAIKINKSKIDDKLVPTFEYNNVRYYDDYIQTSFDTEEDAIKWAYNTDEWANWLILPVISFDNF